MENWEVEIKKFDQDLKMRMEVIKQFERFQFTEATERIRIHQLLGIPIPGIRPCWRDHKTEYYRRNSERWRVYADRWRKNPKNREKVLAQKKRWHLKNRERLLVKMREYNRLRRVERQETEGGSRTERTRQASLTSPLIVMTAPALSSDLHENVKA